MELEKASVSGNDVIEEEVIENEEIQESTEELPEEIVEEPVGEIVEDSPENILDNTEDSENIVENDATVSGGEVPADAIAVVEDIGAVSGSDSVSGGDVYYVTEVPEEPPMWEKPLKEYTVIDGLILTFLVVCAFVAIWIAFWKKG